MQKTFKEHIDACGVSAFARLLGVSDNYLFKVRSGSRPLSDHLLAHGWRKLGAALDLEGSIRERSIRHGNTNISDDLVEAEIALVVILAHRYAVEEGAACSGLSITLAGVVRDMMGVDRVKG